jgi:ribonucleoside-triphosphate reductase
LEDLKRKVGIATILGTIQSTYTHFPYLRKIWQKNTEEERLLGVSLTGIYDHPVLSRASEETSSWLAQLKQQAIDTNTEWAERLSIPVSVAITCVKPSGTVSQLVNSASGIHPRYARNYIRTVRGDNKDPLTQFLISEGVPSEPCVMRPDNTTVFSFPMRAPEEAVVTSDVSALDQLKLWLVYQENWCEHKPSVTIMVKDEEWMSVGAFVYDNFDKISGVSFLPYNEHSYKQAPYQEVREEELPEEVAINWDKLKDFENGIDTTEASQEFACSSGACAI